MDETVSSLYATSLHTFSARQCSTVHRKWCDANYTRTKQIRRKQQSDIVIPKTDRWRSNNGLLQVTQTQLCARGFWLKSSWQPTTNRTFPIACIYCKRAPRTLLLRCRLYVCARVLALCFNVLPRMLALIMTKNERFCNSVRWDWAEFQSSCGGGGGETHHQPNLIDRQTHDRFSIEMNARVSGRMCCHSAPQWSSGVERSTDHTERSVGNRMVCERTDV